MIKTIKYVTGISKERTIEKEKFEKFRSKYVLNEENVDVWKYFGPLKRENFDTLEEVFCSDQFFELGNNKNKFLDRLKKAIKGKFPLTQTCYLIETISPPDEKRSREDFFGRLFNLKKVVSVQPYEKKSANVKEIVLQHIGDHFISELEKAVEEIGMPTCANNALNFVQKSAKNKGLFVPISYSYPTNKIRDLSYDTQTLVFVDEKFEGNIELRKTKTYNDQHGYIEMGKISVNVCGQKKEADWDSYQSNSLRWIVDSIIRKDILSEKEGVNFIRL